MSQSLVIVPGASGCASTSASRSDSVEARSSGYTIRAAAAHISPVRAQLQSGAGGHSPRLAHLVEEAVLAHVLTQRLLRLEGGRHVASLDGGCERRAQALGLDEGVGSLPKGQLEVGRLAW